MSFLNGQTNLNPDSLNVILQNTKDETARARLLLRLSMAEELRDPGIAYKYAEQARLIAQRADYDSAEVRSMILMGTNLIRMHKPKEAIEIGIQIIEKATRYNMQLEIADGRGLMAVAYALGGDFDNSSKLYFENLKLYEKLNERRLLGSTLGNIGVDFIEQQTYKKALEYTKRALDIGLEINDLTLQTDQFNNLAAIYESGFADYTNALNNYFKAYSVAIKTGDIQQQGTILLNIGHIYLVKKKYDSAYNYLNQSFLLYKKLDNPILLADSYTFFGSYYFQTADYVKGKQFALSALEIGRKYGLQQSIIDVSNILHKICLSENDTAGAYHYHIILSAAKDSLYKMQKQKELFRIEFQYSQEKIAKEQKLRQLSNYFILGFIILGLISGLSIIILFNSRQKIKIKNTLLEKEKVETNLKFKSKELSINLLALLKKNELITEISQKLSEIENAPSNTDLKEAAAKLRRDVKNNSDDRLWQEFTIRFSETNSEFYEILLTRYPDLSQSELKLCAYLRLNMSTKEISDLTGQRTESLEKARYRLRKKFGLTNSESNLVAFLSQI
ncbi:MAG: sel1 repeat family protein [Bacteroidales bacterium]|nr:sel1 repeat family protein [Bacteroidales bacterium]